MLQPGVERAARSPRSVDAELPSPERALPPTAEPSDGLSGLGVSRGGIDLGLRSRTRFSPGYHRTGFQPSTADDRKHLAGGSHRCLVSLKTLGNQEEKFGLRGSVALPE